MTFVSFFVQMVPSPRSSFGSDAIQGLWVRTPAWPTFFLTFEKSHCDKLQSSSINGLTIYAEKQLVAWKEGCVEYWCDKDRKYMSRWTGFRDITEQILKTALKPNQSLVQMAITFQQYFSYIKEIPGKFTTSFDTIYSDTGTSVVMLTPLPLVSWCEVIPTIYKVM